MFPQCCRRDDAAGCLPFRLLKLSNTSSVNNHFLCDLVSELFHFSSAYVLNLHVLLKHTRTCQRIKDAVKSTQGAQTIANAVVEKASSKRFAVSLIQRMASA